MAICHQSPFKPFTLVPLQSSKHNPIHLRCNFSLPSRPILTISEPEPVFTSVKAFAPATVTNLGLGFDFLGYTVDGLGDFTSLTIDPQVLPGEISISEICGDHNSKKLSKNPSMSPRKCNQKPTFDNPSNIHSQAEVFPTNRNTARFNENAQVAEGADAVQETMW
ncbi:hypothetical protein COP2_027441 [Malus domestica]